jgi:hypothetical protein
MVVAWIIALWLLSLVVFVALRAYGTRASRTPGGGDGDAATSAVLPAQREKPETSKSRPSESRPQLTDRG